MVTANEFRRQLPFFNPEDSENRLVQNIGANYSYTTSHPRKTIISIATIVPFKPLKITTNLNYVQKVSSHLRENTFRLHYKDQSVNAV
jgi:hypothetical protein